MIIFEAPVTEILQRTYNVKSFRFKMTEPVDFQSGQFMAVMLPVDGKEQFKYFSFSNSPTEKGYIEFTKKITDSAFSGKLQNLKVGDRVKLKMPIGNFILDEKSSKHAFLAGGIGITPIRSMWKYVFDKKLPVDMALFYGNRSPQDILFKEEFKKMAGDHFKVIFSLDTQEACPRDWTGHCGFIDSAMIRKELPDYAERIFYVCGPPAMVTWMTEMLQDQLKVPKSQIKKENFAGY